MHDITDIFDTEIQGDPSDALDAEIAAAGEWVEKLAASEGIDLDSLPADDVADLILKMSGHQDPPATVPSTEDQQTKEASMSTENQITNVDVSRELAKAAAAEGIDLTKVSEAVYAEAWDKMAQAMQQPDWAEKQAAQAEKQAADEQAYQTGVKIAQGFIESVNAHFSKEAMDDDKKAPPFAKKDDEKSDDDDDDDESEKESSLAANAPAKDPEVEALAFKIAQQTLIDQGIDPATGQKLSAEQLKLAKAEARAVEILKEHNWLS